MSNRLQDEVELVFYGTTGAQPPKQPSFQARPHLVKFAKTCCVVQFQKVPLCICVCQQRATPDAADDCIADLHMAPAGTKNNLDDQQPGEWPHVTVTLPLMYLRMLCSYTVTQ